MSPNADRIASALLDVAESLGASSLTIRQSSGRTYLEITAESDDDVYAIARHFGLTVEMSDIGSAWWLEATRETDDLDVTVEGPHHSPSKVRPSKVAAAVQAAEGAVRS